MPPKHKSRHSLIADYFIFPKYQRRAAIILVILCLSAIFIPMIYLHFHDSNISTANAVVVSTESRLKAKLTNENDREENRDFAVLQSSSVVEASTRLFYFDPNTASFEDWQKLGIREKTIHTIQNYVSKGGKFRKPDDLKKIYGMRPGDADRLIPYARITDSKSAPSHYSPAEYAYDKKEPGTKNQQPIEINSADTTAFIRLPGIGSKLAARIVNYREKLGGFYTVDQIAETYGLPDSTFQLIKPRLVVEPSLVKRIKLNTASAEELKTVLIRYNVANAIFQYRQKNGPFTSLDELKNIPIIDAFLFEKIIHYLVID